MAAKSWTARSDVVDIVRKRWQRGEFLTALAEGRAVVPQAVPLRGPSAREVADRFGEVQEWVRRWEADSSGLRLEYVPVGGRLVGAPGARFGPRAIGGRLVHHGEGPDQMDPLEAAYPLAWTAVRTPSPLSVKKGSPRMPAKNENTQSGGFSAQERAAMKERAAELRAEGKKGAKAADGLQAVLDRIAEMAPEDRTLAERVHVTVTATAPELFPRTWYGMPAYANADDKVVVFFQDAGKFNYRFATLGFQDAANLDDGDMWPVSYAVKKWSPAVEKRVVELVKAAVS